MSKRAAEESASSSSSSKRQRTDDGSTAVAASPAELVDPVFFTADKIKALHDEFASAQPFAHAQVQQFFEPTFFQSLQDALAHQDFNNKATDLFSFFQTNDLQTVNDEPIAKLRSMLYGQEFRHWMEQVTGITGLTDQVDMSGAIYTESSFLLCHDDHVEGRRIAYIIYFVDDQWSAADGGQLALFDSVSNDDEGRCYPGTIAKAITPSRNSIAFFAVGDKSFHEVTEVLTDRGRMSLSGWFYGPPIEYQDFPTEKPPTFVVPQPFGGSGGAKEVLKAWLHPKYMRPKTLEQIAEAFEDESSIELDSFLVPSKYARLLKELDAKRASMQLVGPPVKKNYLLHATEQSGLLGDCIRFLKSDIFADFLRQVTHLTPNDMYFEAQAFGRGHYTVIHDDDYSKEVSALDAVFYLLTAPFSASGEAIALSKPAAKADAEGADGDDDNEEDEEESSDRFWDEEWGGLTVYLAGEETLLSCQPNGNALSLVFRDKGCTKFVRRINHWAESSFYSMNMSYRVEEEGQEVDDEELAALQREAAEAGEEAHEPNGDGNAEQHTEDDS